MSKRKGIIKDHVSGRTDEPNSLRFWIKMWHHADVSGSQLDLVFLKASCNLVVPGFSYVFQTIVIIKTHDISHYCTFSLYHT